MKIFHLYLFVILLSFMSTAEMLLDHDIVLDAGGRLQPSVSYDKVIVGSMTYIKNCPTVRTRHGQDPWFLVTSKLNPDFTFRRNQNNQGSNAYYAVETLRRYLPLRNDREAIRPVKLLLDRVLLYHTPSDWKWPNVPRTQDDSPDGHYSDAWSGVDKMCMVGIAYLRFSTITGEAKYIEAAECIATTILDNMGEGDEEHSPLPFRVNMKTGEILDSYTSGMVFPVIFMEELAKQEGGNCEAYLQAKDTLWQWVLDYPAQNNRWSGYYEDVASNPDNLNQHIPLETARYMLDHFSDRPDEYEHFIPALIRWVQARFGQTKHYGATSIREQDGCFREMSSHTARYVSIVAGWWALCESKQFLAEKDRAILREEARSALALCTYSTWSRYSSKTEALNYVGVGYLEPWFSDSYFDFLPHVMDTLSYIDKETTTEPQ